MVSEANLNARRNKWIALGTQGDVDVVARTIWGEARGEGEAGMQAVANVIANRVRAGGWWGNSWIAVCLKRWQFTAWEPAPLGNREKMLAVTIADPSFAMAWQIATRAVAGQLSDLTGGATHYKRRDTKAAWADTGVVSASIGAHDFYTGVA